MIFRLSRMPQDPEMTRSVRGGQTLAGLKEVCPSFETKQYNILIWPRTRRWKRFFWHNKNQCQTFWRKDLAENRPKVVGHFCVFKASAIRESLVQKRQFAVLGREETGNPDHYSFCCSHQKSEKSRPPRILGMTFVLIVDVAHRDQRKKKYRNKTCKRHICLLFPLDQGCQVSMVKIHHVFSRNKP